MQYGNNCWVDIQEADKNRVVVLPLGSLEQHGHHSPLLTDTYLVNGSGTASRTGTKAIRFICFRRYGLVPRIIIWIVRAL